MRVRKDAGVTVRSLTPRIPLWKASLMRARRVVIALSSLALVAAGGLGLAPSASADVVCPVLIGGSAPYTVTPSATPGVNWAGCDLSNADLPFAALTGANLTGANLTGANLFFADMTGASLAGANLAGANLFVAYLTNADLTNADLTGSILTSANLDGAFVLCSNTGVLGTGISGEGYTVVPSTWIFSVGTLVVPIVPCGAATERILMWLQSTGRTTATSTCPSGTNPSWAMWPNNGTGGYVCDKFVIA